MPTTIPPGSTTPDPEPGFTTQSPGMTHTTVWTTRDTTATTSDTGRVEPGTTDPIEGTPQFTTLDTEGTQLPTTTLTDTGVELGTTDPTEEAKPRPYNLCDGFSVWVKLHCLVGMYNYYNTILVLLWMQR